MTEIADILQDAQRRMNQSVEVLKQDLSTYRTGRASVSLVENISVDYHGSAMPLQQLATINMPEARLLVIQPWDKSILPEIEKVLIQSDFGNSFGRNLRFIGFLWVTLHRRVSEIQKVTDLIISEIDKIGESKENEMLEV